MESVDKEWLEKLAKETYPDPVKPYGMDWQNFQETEEKPTERERASYQAGYIQAIKDVQKHILVSYEDTKDYGDGSQAQAEKFNCGLDTAIDPFSELTW